MTPYTASQELHDLAFRYALAVDTIDPGMFLTLFTVDGAVLGFGENPIEFRGEAGLREMIIMVDKGFHRTMHNVFNQTFQQDDAGAISGLTYCIASHIMASETWTLVDMAIRYHNLYAQDGGIWKFVERKLEVLWVENRPVQKFTAAMMDADLKEFK